MEVTLEGLREDFPACPPDIHLDSIDLANIPRHVAVIMDGNGRWAKERGLSRGEGHRAGVQGVRELIQGAHDLGVDYLTIYSFSTENWKRPEDEVSGLMALFAKTMLKELKPLLEKKVRIRLLGDVSKLPKHTREVFEEAQKVSSAETGMTLLIAVNYGGRDEIVHAARTIAEQVRAGLLGPEQVDESVFSAHLYAPDIPDPDLLIRSSGEMRVSNFLLWQIAYSEFFVTDKLWPDFDRYELVRAVLDYQGRKRRYGGV